MNDSYTVWYQTSGGSASGKKALNLNVADFGEALIQATAALSDLGWTIVSMRTYNNTTDKTGLCFLYDIALTVNTTDVP